MLAARRPLTLAVLLAATLSGGCNTIASTLGFTPPVHKLIPPAEQFRMQAVNPAPLAKELDKAPLPAYVVEPGDTLSVEPVDLDSPVRLPGNQPVLPDGTIDLGKYGRPAIAWKTVPQIETEVRQLIAGQTPAKDRAAATVTVRLIGRESKVFYVLGEVNAPRAYPLAGRETVLDGILIAGGLTRQADAKKVIVSRPSRPEGCRTVLPVCYNQIVQLGDTSTNYQLQPGDRIYVPSQSPIDDFVKKLRNRGQPECGPCRGPQVPCVGGNCVAIPEANPGERPA
jgi:protein involved in polysaccharide export with SLBB domain